MSAPPNPPDTSTGDSPKDELVGRVLEDRYQIVRLLAEGGMAKVYVGKHTTLGREVAIKVLKPAFAADPDGVQRFINEGRAAGMLGHRNIIECSDIGKTPDGKPYLVLELLKGHSVAQEIDRAGPFSSRRTARIALRIADALSAAHAAGIIHRDLKTDNVFLARRNGSAEEVKVLDFGVSKFNTERASTLKGSLLGTPDFMSPEQVVDPGAVDERTDVYAVGAILYEMLSARRPFEGVGFPMVLHSIVHEPPPGLASIQTGILPELVAVVERAMAKRADDRYASMTELSRALLPFAELRGSDPGVSDRPDRPPSERRGREPFAELAATLAAPTSERISVRPSESGPPSGERVSVPAETATPTADEAGEPNSRGWAPTSAPVTHPPPPPSPRSILSGLGSILVALALAIGAYSVTKPAAPPAGSTLPARAQGDTIKVFVRITPPDATVDVDGRLARLADGTLTLEGAPGSVRAVRATAGGKETRMDVVLGLDGAHPAAIDVDAAPASSSAGNTAASTPRPVVPSVWPAPRPKTDPEAPSIRDNR